MLISASFTPFNDDYSLNLDMVGSLYSNLADQGVSGTMVCGTTGEGYSMSNKERKLVVEEWGRAADKDFKLYVHVGHNSIPDIKELSAHAIEQGAEALVFSAPTFFKPATVGDLALFLKESVIKDAGIKIYYYHIPSLTGVNFKMIDFLEAAETHQLPLTGIKYTHDDMADFEACLHYKNGKYDMMFGQDENLLKALDLGAKVALGSTYNYMAGIFHQMIKEHEQTNQKQAEILLKEARKIIDILIKYGGGVIGGKAFMRLTGINCGPVRLPLRSATKEKLKTLKAELQKTKYYKYSNII